jgi:hypothetical protein
MPPSQETIDDLRIRLGSPTTAKVSDAQLINYLEEALRKFNRYRPREATAELTLSVGVSLYDLPDGVRSIRRVYRSASPVAPLARPGPAYPTVADDWTEALGIAVGVSRDLVLYGGDVYIEAGRIVVTPPATAVETVLIVYPRSWTWAEVEDTDNGIYDDVMLWAEHRGWLKVLNNGGAGGGLKAISRMGQQTVFGDPADASDNAASALERWKDRVERARVGPSTG